MKTMIHRKEEGPISPVKQILTRVLEWMGIGAKNLRRFSRFECTIPVEIHLDRRGDLSVINAVAKNISSGGMLIKCATLPASITQLEVSFRMPEWFPSRNRTREITTKAHVRHNDPSSHYWGLAFTQPM